MPLKKARVTKNLVNQKQIAQSLKKIIKYRTLYCTYGVPFLYLWCTYGVLLVYLWCTIGVLLVYHWCSFGLLMV